MEALQTDQQITPITTIKRHTAATAGRVKHRPRSFEDRRGRRPLITWDLDPYPQPPTNTHSPTLNTEESEYSELPFQNERFIRTSTAEPTFTVGP